MKFQTNIALSFLLFCSPFIGMSQGKLTDEDLFNQVVTDFRESIATKDSLRFNALFFSEAVTFVGIMSKETEWSIKKDYAEFEGIAVSNHRKFIREICLSNKEQREEFYKVKTTSDQAIGSISFDYAYFSGDRMIQWGSEKWNLVKVGETWLITDVIFSIRFPEVEAFPYGGIK